MSDKSNLKKIRKRAENARKVSSVPAIGDRFPDTYEWGEDLLNVVISMEARIRELEERIADTELTEVRKILSDAIVYITTEQTINSDAFIGQETSQTINADSEVSS